ncbi:MAG: MFS transporter [Dehalogenimonas sp.]|uniref:MFS transporter n=1 Tax=Candidatus Dehalogenimonas loeffleri TaxID=3127115 RepID=A0ABZ2J181_9CHLR|nr:MFS transporter [Dehalogenimonas sp.]
MTDAAENSNRAVRRATLAAAVLASFLTPFMGSSVNIALPVIGREFGLDAITLGWVATTYILAAAVFLLPFGRLADIKGRRRIFISGLVLYTLVSVAIGFSQNGAQLIGLRAAQGISAALLFGTGIAILTSVYPPAERGRVLGINAAAVYIGLSLGPTAGGLLTSSFGWRSIFFVTAAIALVALFFIVTRLKTEWQEASNERFDLKGAVVYGLSLTTLMLGFSELPDTTGFILTVIGIVGMAGFIALEGHTPHPILSLNLFRYNTVFALSNAATLINYAATFATGFLLSLYLQFVKGFSPAEAGLILVAQPILMAFISPYAGRLADRFDPRTLATIGMGLSTAGLAMLVFISENTAMLYLIAALIILGTGFGFFSSPNSSAVMGAVPRRQYGIASATLSTMRLVGQMFSLGIVMLLFALIIGRVQISPEVHVELVSSLRVAFAMFTGLCLVGVFASWPRGNKFSQNNS